jgi:exonuclease III
LTELWTNENEEYIVHDLIQEGKTALIKSTTKENRIGRKSGGIAWIIDNKLINIIKVEHKNERISTCIIDGKKKTILVGVYLPSMNSMNSCEEQTQKYEAELIVLKKIILDAKTQNDEILIIGDFNADLWRNETTNDKVLLNFIQTNQLRVRDHMFVQPLLYTYIGHGRSRIDHVLTLKNHMPLVTNIEIKSFAPFEPIENIIGTRN